MCHHQRCSAGPQLRNQHIVPVGEHPLHHIPQTLGVGELLGRERGVARVVRRVAVIHHRERRRRGVVAPTPGEDLLLAVLRRGLLLVEPLQRTVVALVEPPVAIDRDEVEPRRIKANLRGVDGPAQQRGMHRARQDALLAEQLAGRTGLAAPLLAQVHIGPACEPVLHIPGALAVTEQNQFVAHGRQLPWYSLSSTAIAVLQTSSGTKVSIITASSFVLR